MRRAKRLMMVTAAAVLAGAPAYAADGILIAQKVTNGSNTTTTETQIENTRMRTEITGPNGRKNIMIFDGGAQVMRVIDEGAKTYSEITKADVDRMAAQMAGAMAQVQQQLQNLPPEQRARVEAMMQGAGRGMAGIAAAQRQEYHKAGGTDKVGRWTCEKYEGTRNGVKASEICTVDPSGAGFTPADFEVTKQFAEFMSKMMPQGLDRIFSLGSAGPTSFSGFPVKSVSYDSSGKVTATMELTDVSRQNFPESLWAVPAGLQKRDFPGGRGRQ
jgi:uncharacterized protein DUF4412